MAAAAQSLSLDAQRVEAIRRLNDDLRVRGLGGQIMLTAGVRDLPAMTQALAFRAIRAFDAFTHDNDPHRERDSGSVTVADETLFWKIDTYNRSLTACSPNAADATVTKRVMTIMRADEC